MPAGNDGYEPRVFIDFRWPAFASFIFVSVIGKRRRQTERIRDYVSSGSGGRGGRSGGRRVLRARVYFGTRPFCERMNLVSQVCRPTGNRELVFLFFFFFGYIFGMKECYMENVPF